MQITPFISSINGAKCNLEGAIERLVSQSDAKQFQLAGIELGRIEELAARIVDTCQLAKDALWADSQ